MPPSTWDPRAVVASTPPVTARPPLPPSLRLRVRPEQSTVSASRGERRLRVSEAADLGGAGNWDRKPPCTELWVARRVLVTCCSGCVSGLWGPDESLSSSECL